MWKRTCKLTSSHLHNYYTKMCKLIPIKGIQASFKEVQVNRTSSCLHTVCFHKTQKSNKAFILELPNFSMTFPVFSSGSSNTYIHICLPMHFMTCKGDLILYYQDFSHFLLLLFYQSYQVPSPVISTIHLVQTSLHLHQ